MYGLGVVRENDIPKSLYPGMWLQEPETTRFFWPTLEVLRVGRTHATVHKSGSLAPDRLKIVDIQQTYRKVYASTKEEPMVPDWVYPGADFDAPGWDLTFRVKSIRWGYISAQQLQSGLLLFFRVSTLLTIAVPQTTVWDRLKDDPLC